MLNPFLIPRLNYDFLLKYLIISLCSLFKKKNINYLPLINLFGRDKIFFLNHARTGLKLILNSLNLSKGSNIGVQVLTCHTVFKAISKAGYNPLFIDTNNSYTIDLNDLEKKKDSIDALIVTHTFGIPADFNEIKKIIPEIPVIEDCAHSFLSRYKGRLTGTFGDASIFSFGNAKFPSIGNGGFCIINNENILKEFQNRYNQLPSISTREEILNIIKNFTFSIAHKKPFYGLITFPLFKKIDKKMDFAGKFDFKEATYYNSYTYLFLKEFHQYKKYYEKQRVNANFIINHLNDKFEFIKDSETKKLNYFMIPIRSNKQDKFIERSILYGIEFGKHFSNSIKWAKDFGFQHADLTNFLKKV